MVGASETYGQEGCCPPRAAVISAAKFARPKKIVTQICQKVGSGFL
jgi:hypothetical protein